MLQPGRGGEDFADDIQVSINKGVVGAFYMGGLHFGNEDAQIAQLNGFLQVVQRAPFGLPDLETATTADVDGNAGATGLGFATGIR